MFYSNRRYAIKKNFLFQELYEMAVLYSAPAGLSYLWNFGSLALVSLLVQVITGVFLAMFYSNSIYLAFDSIEHIMRDVPFGWFMRYAHANGASMFFLVVYCHLFRGLFFGSYFSPRYKLWVSGIIILFLMMGIAFMGYVLPWGQMSFWGATVITNLASAIPFCGNEIVVWFWGGFSVDEPTLARFFSLHYLLPFALLGIVIIHLILLHEAKSSDALGLNIVSIERIPFGVYYIIKDIYGAIFYFLIFSFFVFFYPNVLGHSDNYIEANPMVTPAHIVPEWYFLPFYAVLRAVPDKLLGVILMIFAILIFALFPLFNFIYYYTLTLPLSAVNRMKNRRIIFKVLLLFLMLGFFGGLPAVGFYVYWGTVFTKCFFFLLIVAALYTTHCEARRFISNTHAVVFSDPFNIHEIGSNAGYSYGPKL